MMTLINLPKHHSQQNKRSDEHNDCFIGFWSPSLPLTFRLLQMVLASRYFWESPGGVFPSALKQAWGGDGLSLHWGPPGNESPPQWKHDVPLEYQTSLFMWRGGKETALLLGLLLEGSPSRVAWATCAYIRVPEAALCKQLILPSTPCPIRTQPGAKSGTRPGDQSNNGP